MNTLRSPRSFSPTAAFTLIELLAVIAIISILMGLLLPVINAVKESSRRTLARQSIEGIVVAVTSYHADYGKYPPMQSSAAQVGGTPDEGVGDSMAEMTSDNSVLFNTLRAIDRGLNEGHEKNPKRVVYFEGKAVSDPDQPRSGFVDMGSGPKRGSFFDPWGTQYNMVVDSNHDNQVDVNQYYTDVPVTDSPRSGVVAFSLGRDGKLGAVGNKKARDKSSDDILSWK